MLKKEFQYYPDHQNGLVKKYNGRTFVIQDCKVIGDCDDFEQALYQTVEKGYEPGAFLI